MQTKRRIAVTAAPHASNLLEYPAVANWAVPGALGSTDIFSDVFLKPVMIAGLLESDVEAWDRGRRAAGLLVNRIKTFAFPLSGVPTLAISQHVVARVCLMRSTVICIAILRGFRETQALNLTLRSPLRFFKQQRRIL
jgi:hypothetical protein